MKLPGEIVPFLSRHAHLQTLATFRKFYFRADAAEYFLYIAHMYDKVGKNLYYNVCVIIEEHCIS